MVRKTLRVISVLINLSRFMLWLSSGLARWLWHVHSNVLMVVWWNTLCLSVRAQGLGVLFRSSTPVLVGEGSIVFLIAESIAFSNYDCGMVYFSI